MSQPTEFDHSTSPERLVDYKIENNHEESTIIITVLEPDGAKTFVTIWLEDGETEVSLYDSHGHVSFLTLGKPSETHEL